MAEVKEKITPIGNIRSFLNTVLKKTDELNKSFRSSGEAIDERFELKLDEFNQMVLTEGEKLLKEDIVKIDEYLEELEEKRDLIYDIKEEHNAEKVVIFNTETLEELMWVEKMRVEFCEKFGRKTPSDNKSDVIEAIENIEN